MASAPYEVSPPRPAQHSFDVRAYAYQGAALAGVLALLAIVLATTAANLQSRGIPLGLQFLVEPAGFSIAETVLPFSPTDTALWAILVGIINTLLVSVIVIGASTVLGTFLGIARLSENPLVSGLARTWVEVARNTPPILLLIFIYTLWQIFPPERSVQLAPGILGSIRGLAIPAIVAPWSPLTGIAFVLAVAAGGIIFSLLLGRSAPAGAVRRVPGGLSILALLTGVSVVAVAAAQGTFSLSLPAATGADIRGGAILTPELAAILIGLTIYSSGFVAEIVRGGINYVPVGMWEAARALGLSPRNVLRLVVLPQVLRVVIPPMTSQYINIVKNSTLALAVGYTDFLTIMGTMINKTSHAIEGTAIIILVYLSINLSLSAALNWYNARVEVRGR